ncbi:uncharacterized protein LOC132556409 [Ylistrum balloti]|uniref:uncharacterized protein LOC132556409 n=1 Tax=Ylistrum balloti TaxID=509963 RepID=UPI0029059771|nr:uncharacterized protein LOC132556409 [Ylistrum balloti]
MDVILQSLCQCGICHESVSYPKKLKCQHIFCHECLIGYISEYFGQTLFHCPVCKYKHTPQEPETEVSDTMLSALEEDSLTRNLRQFYSDENERPAIQSSNGVLSPLCSIHPRNRCSYYCEACNVLVCPRCRVNMHRGCHLETITKTMETSCYNRMRQISTDIETVKSRTQLLHGKLVSKLEHAIPDRENTESTVKAYYADLKENVIHYLEQQEDKILKKAKELEEKEKMYLDDDISVCSSLLTSLDAHQKLIIALLLQTSIKPSQNMILAGDLSKIMGSFTDILPDLESDLMKSFDLRFMINTELEDKMTNVDIVNIEVIDSCHSGPYIVTFEDNENPDSPGEDGISESGLLGEDEEGLPTYECVLQQPSLEINCPSSGQRPLPTAPPMTLPQNMNLPSTTLTQPSAPPLPESELRSGPGSHYYHSTGSSESTIDHSNIVSDRSLANNAESAVDPHVKDGIARLQYKDYIDIQLSGDINIPSLVAIATVGDTFVVLDRSNYCMKVLSQHGGLLNVHDFGYVEPWDVAAVSDVECVVTAPKQKQLLFLRDPALKQGEEISVRKALTTGQYAYIAFHKETELLIGCLCPPFCSTRIDVIDLQGRVRRKIPVDYCQSPRNIVVTKPFDLILSDLDKSKVIFFKSSDTNHINKKTFVGHAALSFSKQQGIAIVDEMDLLLILDSRNGDLTVASFSGQLVKVLPNQISVEGSAEIDTQMCTSMDGTTLAVTSADGFVSLYDIEYSYLPSVTQV